MFFGDCLGTEIVKSPRKLEKDRERQEVKKPYKSRVSRLPKEHVKAFFLVRNA